jgi:hypothetical protein
MDLEKDNERMRCIGGNADAKESHSMLVFPMLFDSKIILVGVGMRLGGRVKVKVRSGVISMQQQQRGQE